MGLSERPPPEPLTGSVANRESEDVDGTCYRHVNHNADNLDNNSEDLDNKAFNPKDNSSPITESKNNMKRTSTRKPSESSVIISSIWLRSRHLTCLLSRYTQLIQDLKLKSTLGDMRR